MKEFRGTKGKWYTHISPQENKCWIGGKHIYFIGEAYTNGRDFEEAKANAKLIASAPEMLSELQILITESEWIIDPIKMSDDYIECLNHRVLFIKSIERAKEIINKALE